MGDTNTIQLESINYTITGQTKSLPQFYATCGHLDGQRGLGLMKTET